MEKSKGEIRIDSSSQWGRHTHTHQLAYAAHLAPSFSSLPLPPLTMGALCGKPADDETSYTSGSSGSTGSNAQQNSNHANNNNNAATNNNHAISVPPPAASSSSTTSPPATDPLLPPLASSGSVVDERDIIVSLPTGNEPEFNNAEAEKQAAGDEAYSFWDRNKTFKPERQFQQGSKAHTMQATMKATLGGGELQNTVKLPDGEDLNEWIAVNS